MDRDSVPTTAEGWIEVLTGEGEPKEAALEALRALAQGDPRFRDLLVEALGVQRERRCLSNRDIRLALEDGRLSIIPQPDWTVRGHGTSQFDVDSFTLRLGFDLLVLPQGFQFDLGVEHSKHVLRKHGKKKQLKPGEKYPLGPRELVVALTLEHVSYAKERKPEFDGRPLLCAVLEELPVGCDHELSGLTRNARCFIRVERCLCHHTKERAHTKPAGMTVMLANQLHGGDAHPVALEIYNEHDCPLWFRPFRWLLQYRWFQQFLDSKSRWVTWLWHILAKPTVFYLTAGEQWIAQIRFFAFLGEDPEVDGRGGNVRGQNGACGNGGHTGS